ncbi:MAG: hypothetical protein IPN05_19805 [Sulfuritalea sp.]|nr:hypothetical protein [Sulfuritalea sp.]
MAATTSITDTIGTTTVRSERRPAIAEGGTSTRTATLGASGARPPSGHHVRRQRHHHRQRRHGSGTVSGGRARRGRCLWTAAR